MSRDFRDAAMRHHEDAEHLFSAGRLPNSDHLFGLAAECSIKAVMESLGMKTNRKGAPMDYAHKAHMPQQWAAFQSFASGTLGSRYLSFLNHENPFLIWDVEQRYWKRQPFTQCRVRKHRDASNLCITCLTELILDGVEPARRQS
jgi:hypothetical protein